MKSHLKDVSAIPSKRIYLSIIADYHLDLALCELIDNAIDNWIYNGRLYELEITLNLDYERQLITVKDNSGGIKESDISLIVSPGHSRENNTNEIIGVFGVGSKRAVVALAENVKIFSRHSEEKTLLVELNNDWIEDEDNWRLPVFETSSIEPNTTLIELSILRDPIAAERQNDLLDHLAATYALFIDSGGMKILLNGIEVGSKTFENWSFPPGYEPQEANGPIDFGIRGIIQVNIIAGLIQSHRDGDSNSDEYGVYFYCNNRLISRAYKGPEVGFKPPRIGAAHPSKSIARVIVKLTGPVELMPWNSSKSEIDFKHAAFKQIEDHIERMLFAYTSMSKNWQGEWPEKIFQYQSGQIQIQNLTDISSTARIHLPIVPRSPRKRKYGELLIANNKNLALRKPWIVGTYEIEIAVDQILQLKLQQSNRIAMLLLDSAIEIAFKEYLINESTTTYSANRLAQIMGNRTYVHTEIKNSGVKISNAQWRKIEHFYLLRCELVHKRSTVTISEGDLNTFRETYKYTINKLFGVNFNLE